MPSFGSTPTTKLVAGSVAVPVQRGRDFIVVANDLVKASAVGSMVAGRLYSTGKPYTIKLTKEIQDLALRQK